MFAVSFKNLFSSPQLYASVLVKDSLTVSKGKSLLEKALKEDSYHLPAVYLLCELYEQVSLQAGGKSLKPSKVYLRVMFTPFTPVF